MCSNFKFLFNMLNLVGHFVSSPREREKSYRKAIIGKEIEMGEEKGV